jgi:hypothetical protein
MYFRNITSLVLFMALISIQSMKASHYMGGEISYEHISGNDYKIRLKIIRDCGGIPLGSSATIEISSPGAQNTNILLNSVSVTDVTQLCPGQQSKCSSPNVGLFGSEEHIFEATRSFPPLANNASYTLALTAGCCRNNAITNLQSPAGNQMYIYTTLQPNLTIKNNSPKILNRAVAYFCNNRPAVISPNAYDKDGDQLRYSFVAPKTVGNTPIPYTSGLSVTNPLVCSSPITINPATGEIRFTPSQQQVAVLSVLIEEFRGGIQIGSMIHEMQIWIANCTNTPPVINPVSSQIATVGSSLCIPIVATDADNNNIALSAVSGLMSQGATFVLNNSTAGASAGTFCFTPTAANQGQTYTVTINARDNQCPVSASTAMSFNITVSGNCPKTGVSFVTTPATCGLNSGTATATLSPIGIAPYSYFWTGAGNFTAFTQQITGLAAGNYSVTVIDARGCIGQNTVAVGRADQLQQLGTVTHATCKFKNGAISVTAVGGTPPYTYKLNGGAGQFTGNFTGLNAGTYTVQVIDANGCNGQATYVVTSSNDTIKPTITCPPNILKTMSPLNATSMSFSIGTPVVTDNCGVASVVKNGPTSYPAGITNVIWTVTDTSGNQNTCTQKIEVRSKMTSIPAVKELK